MGDVDLWLSRYTNPGYLIRRMKSKSVHGELFGFAQERLVKP
jgi:hypothetical protein